MAADEIKTIKKLVRSYYQQRAASITQESRRLSIGQWRDRGTYGFVSQMDADMEGLLDGRDLATNAHGGYTKADTAIDLTVRATHERELTLGVTETTTLHFAGVHPVTSPASMYRIRHQVRLVKASPNRWLLAETRFLPKGALPPLTQPIVKEVSTPRVVGQGDVLDFGSASSIEKDMAEIRKERLKRSTAADIYNHQAMVDRSILFWDRRDSNYPDYHNYGGDCTNFVSQIMWIGGWQEVGPPGRSNRAKWFHGRTVDECSFTWGGANNFHSFAVGYSDRMKLKERVYDLQDSTVVQYDFGGDNTIDHTQFVTDSVYDEKTVELYMTQHDEDYLKRPLTEILARLKQTNPNFRTYALTHSVW